MQTMFDVIVIGSDLSSLIAALLSARYGRKTLLISECGLDDRLAFSGYTFNIDPFPWSGFGTGQIFAKLFSELNIPLPDPAIISPLNPAIQVILPDHRIDFFIEREALIRDIHREYPEEDRQIRNLYDSVSKVSDTLDRAVRDTLESHDRSVRDRMKGMLDMPFFMGEIWRLAQKLRSVEKESSLGSIFESELSLLSNQYVNHDKPLSSAYLLSLPWRGLYYHFGGKHLLLSQFRKRFDDLRGETIAEASVTAVRAGNRIEVDLKQKGKTSGVMGQQLVISAKSPALGLLLSAEGKLSKLARRLRRVETAQYPFTLHMGIDNRGVPDRMGEYVIVIPDRRVSHADAGPFLFLESSVSNDTALAPRGKRTLSATAFLARSPVSMEDRELLDLSEAMIRSLETFLPFLRESTDVLDMARSLEVSRRYQQIVNPRYRFSGLSIPGLMTFPIRSPLPNVAVTGGITFAGLGFEGEVLSGMKAGYLAAGEAT